MTLVYDLFWRPLAAYEIIRGGGYPSVSNSYGRFHVGDIRAVLQFSPLFEPKVKDIVSGATGLFVDVGANIGLMSVLAARNGAEVIAIEPAGATYSLLVENIEANGMKGRIETVRAAAWANSEDLLLEYNDQLALRRIGTEGETVKGVGLDSLLQGRIPSLIKVDVEGRTPEVLHGARETLRVHRPRIVFEARPELDELPPVETALSPFGYSIKRLDRTNWLALA